MGLVIIKSTCYSSRMRGAGVSTQQFSSLQENKISVQAKYAIYDMITNIRRTVNIKRNYQSGYALN